MKRFLIVSKDYRFSTVAHDRREAWRRFFSSIRDDDSLLSKIGQLAMLVEEGKEEEGQHVGMRMVPALYKGGLLPKEAAVANVATVTGANEAEAQTMLMRLAAKDSWVWEAI